MFQLTLSSPRWRTAGGLSLTVFFSLMLVVGAAKVVIATDLDWNVQLERDPCIDPSGLCTPGDDGPRWCGFPGETVRLCSKGLEKKGLDWNVQLERDPCTDPSGLCTIRDDGTRWCGFPGESNRLCPKVAKAKNCGSLKDQVLAVEYEKCWQRVMRHHARQHGQNEELGTLLLMTRLRGECGNPPPSLSKDCQE